jgi:hypothetical protein
MAPARSTNTHSFDDYGDDFWPGERVGPPLKRRSGKTILRGIILLMLAFGGAWTLFGHPTTWRVMPLIETATTLFSTLTQQTAGKTSTARGVPSAAASVEPLRPPALEVVSSSSQTAVPYRAEVAPAPAGTPAIPQITAAVPSAPAESEEPASPLPPPNIDPADPYQQRAMAVGLHPNLSRALLSRLSPTDYRNAGVAIKTAIAETPDTAVLVWPRQRKPELALFQIHFVRGAAPGCRRYVVTITKDGWSTTALPMERCGAEGGLARRG